MKELGLVITPRKTVDYIISKLGVIKKDQTILDPCVGPGVFIEKLLENKIKSSQIYAFDINPLYTTQMEKLGIKFEVKDTLLEFNQESFNEFDYIIGNPPYLNKASIYVQKNKIKLKKLYGKINAHETYSMFIVNSIWRLKEGGKLGFITSDSFLTLSTHMKLRKFILDTCKIDEILLAPKNLFDNQNVNTNPVIIILSKFTGENNREVRNANIMKVISRIKNEDEYLNPKKIHIYEQKKYNLLPFNIFFIDIDDRIINLFKKAHKLEDVIKGYIGMHTHDNLKYIAAVDGTELAGIFGKHNKKQINQKKTHKIIMKALLESKKWKPYMKRGGADQYYRPIMEALDWNPKSIPVYDIPKNVPFEKEGIIISGVSSRLAARYMPDGCYWDSNKAIGFIIRDNSISIEYMLGLLNSSLYNYLAKGIINNTSSIQLTGLHALPFVKPTIEVKKKVEFLVSIIIKNKRKNLNYNYASEQKQIDNIIYDYYSSKYNFPNSLKDKLDSKYSIYSE